MAKWGVPTRQKYVLLQDDNCHWYIVPVSMKDAFFKWVEDYDETPFPDGVSEVGGAPSLVEFYLD